MRVDVYHRLRRCLDADRLAALATVISGPGRGRQLLAFVFQHPSLFHLVFIDKWAFPAWPVFCCIYFSPGP